MMYSLSGESINLTRLINVNYHLKNYKFNMHEASSGSKQEREAGSLSYGKIHLTHMELKLGGHEQHQTPME